MHPTARLLLASLLAIATTHALGCAPPNANEALADATATPEPTPDAYPDPADTVELTDAQWKEKLTADQFYILRQHGTERPFTSPLNGIKHTETPGDFACAGCNNLLFQTRHQFKSGTGWPSFDRPVAAAHVVEEVENDYWRRTEVRCARCDGHLGHVFEDGPRDTTGLRYCINGDALVFYGQNEDPKE